MKLQKKVGATSEIWQIFVRDSSSTTGAGLTGLAFGTSGLTAYYHRDTDTTATAITLVTMTVGTFTSSGFKEIDATNMAPLPIEVQLTAVDPDDGVRHGMTSLPNAAAGATGGSTLPVVRGATAQTGNATSITLDSSASATTDLYRGLLVHIVSGTGAGQVRTIVSYNGASKIANVDRAWFTNPDNTSVFELVVADGASINSSLQVSTASPQTTIRSGTAQTGSTASTIKLDSAASSTDNLYVGNLVQITGGTGLGQSRTIIAYNGTTKVATVDRNWVTTPDNTSGFSIIANLAPTTFSDQGVAQAGGNTSITLASTASATNSVYVGSIVTLLSGTGSGQTREITAYNGTTKVATVDSAWSINPDSTSGYAVIPTASGTGTPTGTLTAADILYTALTEGYAADGATFTLAQALYEICQFMEERSASGTTLTVKKRDGSTSAMTFTLNSSTQPTSQTRAT